MAGRTTPAPSADWTRQPGRIVAAMLLLALSAWGGWRSLARAGEPAAQPARWLVDLNAADQAELQLLPRIGPAMAERIAQDRSEHGPFASVDDLERVRGVGPRTLMQARPHAVALPPGARP
jgi:competence ComEA-like helix-hairpin-helix protein